MILLQIHLVTLPQSVWRSWPPDRALMHLASDALGMERRIQKGVDVATERTRYKLLCDRIETLALEAIQTKRAKVAVLGLGEFGRPLGNAYLRLIEKLADEGGGRVWEDSSANPKARVALAKTIFPPGKEVDARRDFFAHVIERLRAGEFSGADRAEEVDQLEAASIVHRSYSKAARHGHAVVEVVSAMGS